MFYRIITYVAKSSASFRPKESPLTDEFRNMSGFDPQLYRIRYTAISETRDQYYKTNFAITQLT